MTAVGQVAWGVALSAFLFHSETRIALRQLTFKQHHRWGRFFRRCKGHMMPGWHLVFLLCFFLKLLSVTNKILITSVSVWLCDWLNSETRESVSMWSFFVYTFIKLWYPLNFLCMHDSLYLCCRSGVHQAQTALMLSPHWSASFVVACLAVGSWEWEPGCGVCVWSSSLNMRNLSVQFKETAGDLT